MLSIKLRIFLLLEYQTVHLVLNFQIFGRKFKNCMKYEESEIIEILKVHTFSTIIDIRAYVFIIEINTWLKCQVF